MRCWIIVTLLCTLVLLPFSGMQIVSADQTPPASSEPHSSEQSHCDAMMGQKAASVAVDADNNMTTAEGSCCDGDSHSDCSANCPADCGHCFASGAQSGSAPGNELPHFDSQPDERPISVVNTYSHQPLQPTPPPDIG